MAKLTTNQKEWNRHVKRINRFMRELRGQGFVFDVTPEELIGPKPRVITKSRLERLSKVKPETVRMSSRIVPEWYKEGRKTPPKVSQKSAKTQKTKQTRPKKPSMYLPREDVIILYNLEAEISRWSPMGNWTPFWSRQKEKDKNILKNILEGAISRDGRAVVALRLKSRDSEVNTLVQEILYGSGGKAGYSLINLDLKRFSEIVNGRALTINEAKAIEKYIESINSDEEP